MSQLPGEAQIPSPEARVAPRVTASTSAGNMKALGIVEIVFGSLGLMAMPMLWVTKALARDPFSKRVNELTWEGPVGTWMTFAIAAGTVMAVLLIVAGTGVIKLRPWARKLSMVYAVYNLFIVVVGQIINIVYLYPAMAKLADQMPGPVARAGMTGGVVGGIAGGLFSLMLPVALLVILTRRDVKASFGVS